MATKDKENALVTMSRTSDDLVRISVKDASSRLPICDLEMSLEEFGSVITGMSFVPAKALYVPNLYAAQRYGMVAKTERVACAKVTGRKEQKEEVNKDFVENYAPLNWELFDDGVGTQQNGHGHYYVIRKFITQAEADKEAKDFTL